MTTDEIRARLFALQDVKYRDFQAKLIPGVPKETIIGVRTPELRRFAKEAGESGDFLAELPHRYYDENQLHAFIISAVRDRQECLRRVEEFLPYVDNWATCDQMSLKCFRKAPAELLPHIRRWLASPETYTVRFGIDCLMEFFLDENFRPEYPEMVSAVHSEEYYVRMMIAWYFATALAKQYDAVIPYITERRLDPWTHRKTIQKAVESFRITQEQKVFLKTLKVTSK